MDAGPSFARHCVQQAREERIDAGLKQQFRAHPAVRAQLDLIASQVRGGSLPASTAARQLLAAQQNPVFSSPAEPAGPKTVS